MVDKGDGGDDNNESKGFTCGWDTRGKTIAHTHTEDRTGSLVMDEGDGEPGTGAGSTRQRGGPGIGTVLDGHGDQPTDTSTRMLHGDALQQATSAQLASLLTAV